MHMDALPDELLREVFVHLRHDQKNTLSACSLVSRAWSHPAQKTLFHNVRLGPQNMCLPRTDTPDTVPMHAVGTVLDYEAFVPFIQARPGLANAVKELCIEGRIISLIISGSRSLDKDALPAFQISLDTVMTIAEALPALQRLSLWGFVMDTHPQLPHVSISLNVLELNTIGFLTTSHIFDMFKFLRPAAIRVHRCFWKAASTRLSADTDLRNVVAESWYLHDMQIGLSQRYVGELARLLLHTPFTMCVRSLSVKVGTVPTLPPLVALLEACGPNLHTFKIDLQNLAKPTQQFNDSADRRAVRQRELADAFHGFDLSRWASLRRLDFTFAAALRLETDKQSALRVQLVETVLSTMPVSVVEVRLGLCVVQPDDDESRPDAMCGSLLERLNGLLGRLKHLQRVVVAITGMYAATENEDYGVVRVVQDGLPAILPVLHVTRLA
ncbi:hypothetical protein PHLGIDRAFT_459419 [Phlebiopsis gigantea 11061_1 CR5-6]|uniref:F-box domain-containing protein n=1 Tax=Phlebiopsis gigantea (strain 11061_1 CR5-6) TaxID=745531 RepID=A0A0C3S9T8_PHLG1|nr:hypothetical protein PHLGIDRAFT_459419 [Phlebiopsis gigantea 11061_1 CR5-6]